jgi:hypothetical protein
MSESKKRVKVLTYGEDGGAPIEAEVEYAEGDTVRQVCERAFPGAEKGRLFVSTKDDACVPISTGCLAQEDGVLTEYTVKTLHKAAGVDLRLNADILREAVEDGDGFVTVSVGGNVCCAWRVTATILPQ